MSKSITKLPADDRLFRQMGSSLTTLVLSNNRISEIKYLDPLRNLVTLNLASNRISEMENLNFPMLRTLCLDYNQVDSIANVKNLKQLRELSLVGNKVTCASIRGQAVQLIHLAFLNLDFN